MCGVLVALALGVHADELQRSFPSSDVGRLRIALEFGQVDVVPVAADEVRIEAQARGVGASGVHFDARSEGDEVVLSASAEPWVAWLESQPRVQVRAFVPASWSMDQIGLPPRGETLPSLVVHHP
jgi:hypothetical protein